MPQDYFEKSGNHVKYNAGMLCSHSVSTDCQRADVRGIAFLHLGFSPVYHT